MAGRKVAPRRRRDRRGRSLRGALLPARLPAARSRADEFDELVRQAADRVTAMVAHRLAAPDIVSPALADLEVAVDLVPPPAADGRVELYRVEPGGPGRAPRVTVHRRPVEARAKEQVARSELVHDVVVDAVAELLAVSPESIDPDRGERP